MDGAVARVGWCGADFFFVVGFNGLDTALALAGVRGRVLVVLVGVMLVFGEGRIDADALDVTLVVDNGVRVASSTVFETELG